MGPALIDSDSLSEVLKGRDPVVRSHALAYLAAFGQFTFSVITQYEILRGLKAKRATRQIARFEERCRASRVLPITEEIALKAAEIYADLHRRGQIINDADILIAATALVHGLTQVTENVGDFSRIGGLTVESWRVP